MTFQERNNIVAILTNLIIIFWFGWAILAMYQAGDFSGPDGLMVWARYVLWIVPVSIVATIVLTILFNIFFAIATNDGNPDSTVDERDRQIGIRGMQVTMVVVSAGFIGALAGLALGWPALAALNAILAAFALGDLTGNLVKLGLYRRGI